MVEPHVLESGVVEGGDAERFDTGLAEPPPQRATGLDSVPEPLRAALRHRKQPVVVGVKAGGEPAPVGAVPGELPRRRARSRAGAGPPGGVAP